jgi:glucose-6-phosphate 1-dehydrogenase
VAAPLTDALVFFGATGDLAFKQIFPALQAMIRHGHLDVPIIGVARREQTADQLRTRVHDSLAQHGGVEKEAFAKLMSLLTYVSGDYGDPGTYKRLKQALGSATHPLHYLAIPPSMFEPVIEGLAKSGCATDGRVVIEKPFGHDLASAQALNARILHSLTEEQIYRIDHFLGKETVQNIMALRFANGLFEPVWNRDRIDHVQITVAETVGVERRGRFYERTGALRDMVPNHVFQLLAMVAMEPPAGFDARSVRSRKADVFAAMRGVTADDAVRGQYGAGAGGAVAYRQEPDVDPHSDTETFVAMRLDIDNWRWAGVPFYLRTGKHMSKRYSEIAIRFKQAPFAPFEQTDVETLPANWLVLHIQPDEGIALQFEVKRPGPVVDLAAVQMEFKYNDWFPREPNIGYETLIYDAMTGDQTLFNRADMVEETWRVVQPLLDSWAKEPAPDFPNYESGQDGPASADALLERDHRHWRAVGGER